VYVVRRIIGWWYSRRIEREMQERETLKGKLNLKLEELKEKNDYYTTQQLLQRYDAKSPAKTASSTTLPPMDQSSSHLRQRIPQHPPPPSQSLPPVNPQQHTPILTPRPPPLNHLPTDDLNTPDFHPSAFTPPLSMSPAPGPRTFLDRLLDLLVGEDETAPEHRYALICVRCRMHNGLAPPGEMPGEVGYLCARCGQWNGPRVGGNGERSGETVTQGRLGEEVGQEKDREEKVGEVVPSDDKTVTTDSSEER
jgi:endoplasmic reticulum junction formation protein lunapark